VWPGEVVVYDPHAGEIRGHRQMRRFVKRSQSWLAERHARTETVASTVVGDRAVLELLAYLADDGRELAWPVAVGAESPDDRSVVFRAYYSVGPVDGRRQVMLTSAARSGSRQQYAAGRQPAEPARSLVMHWPVPGTWRHSPQRRAGCLAAAFWTGRIQQIVGTSGSRSPACTGG
jgi:hypothetical protein